MRLPLRLALAGVLAATFCAAPAARADEFTELALRWFPSIRNLAHSKPQAPGLTVTISPPVCMCDSFSPHVIRRVIRLHMPQLTECFEHEAQYGHPELAGHAVLRFTILPSGKTTAAAVDSDLADDAVDRCLAHEVAGWQFPPTEQASEVRYPLNFQRLK